MIAQPERNRVELAAWAVGAINGTHEPVGRRLYARSVLMEIATEAEQLRGAMALLAEARDYVSATAPGEPTRDLLLRIDAALHHAGA